MRTKIDCCCNCKKRHIGCHGDCPDYAKQNSELKEYRAMVRAKRDTDAMIAQHIFDNNHHRITRPKLSKEEK